MKSLFQGEKKELFSSENKFILGANQIQGKESGEMRMNAEKKQMDMQNGPIWNKLPVFALPIAATAILEQLFNASDVIIVGNFTGAGKTIAVAAVGANSAIISLIVTLFVGIALGSNVVIATAIGRNDQRTIKKAVHTSIVISILAGFLVLLAGELIAGPLLSSQQIPEEVFPQALLYLRIYLLGMPVILLYNFEAAIFRSIGDTKTPLFILTLSGVINVLLNLFFVAVLHMTVNGVAIATVISNVVSSVVLFYDLRKRKDLLHVEWKELRIDGRILKKIMKIGLPAGIQAAVFSIANIVIQSAINSLGTVIMAASSAAYNVEMIAFDVLSSYGQACTTFVGQNYGSGKIKRCKKVLYLCMAEDTLATAFTILLILLFGKAILSIFTNEPQVIAAGYTRLVIIFSSYVFCMLYETMSGYLRGFGISLLPAVLTTAGICGVRLLWIAFVFPHHRSFEGILAAYPASLSLTALLIFIALLCYRPSKKFQPQGRKEENRK